MKIVIFKGGLGNQLFQYSLYCKLKEAGYKVYAVNCCGESHNGFEVLKYFQADIDMVFSHRSWEWLFYKLCVLPEKLRKRFIVDENHYADHSCALFYNGYWQDKRFMPKECVAVFKQLPLDVRNCEVLGMISRTESVAVHVRRGDYLQKGNSDVFVNLSETNYYSNAIEAVKKKVYKPHFFVFSNDIEWCKEHILSPNVTYADWNTGNDSIKDFYLMSQCKVCVVANSTFSFWAAYMNRNTTSVLYPSRWFVFGTPNIFPDNWTMISCE